jgi:hypothetical protein
MLLLVSFADASYRRTIPSPFGGCVAINVCHCEFTTVNVAISVMSIRYEIASVVTLPRKDIMTQSQRGEGIGEKVINFPLPSIPSHAGRGRVQGTNW